MSKSARSQYISDMYKVSRRIGMTTLEARRYWTGSIRQKDDFGLSVGDTFIDGKTIHGPWAIMTPSSWRSHGVGRLGTGYGQKYKKQSDGRWLKIEG